MRYMNSASVLYQFRPHAIGIYLAEDNTFSSATFATDGGWRASSSEIGSRSGSRAGPPIAVQISVIHAKKANLMIFAIQFLSGVYSCPWRMVVTL